MTTDQLLEKLVEEIKKQLPPEHTTWDREGFLTAYTGKEVNVQDRKPLLPWDKDGNELPPYKDHVYTVTATFKAKGE